MKASRYVLQIIPAALAALLLGGATGHGAAADPWGACRNDAGLAPATQVAACATLIKGGHLSNDDLATAFRRRGRAYIDAGDYARAIADNSEAIRLKPDFADAIANRGFAFAALGQYERALTDLNRAIALRPNAKDFVSRGDVHAKSGDMAAAVKDFGRAVELEPKNIDALNARANALSEIGQDDLALKDYARIIAVDPKFAFAYYNRAIILAARKDYAGAIADYTRAIEIAPFPAALNNRGVAYFESKAHDNAIADYSRAIRMAPAPDFFENRGNVYAAKGAAFFDQARSDLAIARRMNPNSEGPHLQLGVVEYRARNYSKALASLESAVKIETALDGGRNMIVPEARYMRGLTLKALGRAREGQADIDFARRVYPDIDTRIEKRFVARDATVATGRAASSQAAQMAAEQCKAGVSLALAQRIDACGAMLAVQTTDAGRAEARFRRAVYYMALKDWAHAIADLRASTALNPKEPAGFAALADALVRSGDYAGGIAAQGRALELAPMNPGYWAQRCHMRARSGRELQGALSDCQHALELQPNADYLLGARAFAYLVLKNYAQAIADYDASLRQLLPDFEPNPYALFGRGIAKFHIGDRDGGRKDIAAALAQNAKIGEEFAGWGLRP